ncbi:MAG TPA: homoaconitase [Candidatus Polarisedimenticolaceae bacterium]|nr:homoaconitase [Candidatus Polarisedimenticolaceae bacterium]
MGQTVVEKIAQAHLAEGPKRPLRAGDFVSIRPRHVMTHDNTSPVMKKFKAIGAPRVLDPRQPVFCLDHDIQNTSEENLAKYRAIEVFARAQGIDFYPAGSGIGHQIVVEQLYAVPGAFVVASDSHSNMYGGVGAVGTPVVRTDAAAIWATGTFWWQIPRSIQVWLDGRLPAGAVGKDVIVALCGLYGEEVLNAAVEFAGPGVATLTMEERLAIANMTTEWGPLVGWFPVDAVTLDFLRQRRAVLEARGVHRIGDADLARWQEDPPRPDDDAAYAGRIRLDLSEVHPHVSGPDTVQVATPLGELEAQRIKIHKAYLVSCVNSRVEDIASAAAVVRGKKIAPGIEFYIAAASREVEEESQRRGDWQALLDAGAQRLPPGCGPCIGLGAGLLEPGEVGISATNRNFKGRMGSREARCYLASPAVVAASALAGHICGPRPAAGERLVPDFETLAAPAAAAERVEILPGFPERLAGRLVFLPADNMNTDGIYGKDYTYRDDMTPEMMAGVVFENYDPQFAGLARRGDVIVGGWNFGTGSSREQAVTALQAKGIPLVIAGSYSQTYLRNAFNNGFPCVECPELIGRVRELFAKEIDAGRRTIVPGDTLEIDFAAGTIAFRGLAFRFPPLGSVPQALVVAGGVENQVRRVLGL